MNTPKEYIQGPTVTVNLSDMQKENTIDFGSVEYQEFVKDYRNSSGKNKLIVFVGVFTEDRVYAINELKRETMGDAVEVDLSEVITQNEEESYSRIDACIEEIDKDAPLIIFKNAEQLSGAYTSYSASKVRYATPQEKYFIKKVRKIPAPVVLELKNEDQLDENLSRTADVVVMFNPPTSFLEKVAWNFKNIHAHGTQFLSPRPGNK